MRDSHYSAESSPPMGQRLQETIENAGIPVRKTDGQLEFPAQEQAASRSRDQMVSFKSQTPISKGPNPEVENVIRKMKIEPSKSDPNGSWTGVPENPWETPVQDVDDL